MRLPPPSERQSFNSKKPSYPHWKKRIQKSTNRQFHNDKETRNELRSSKSYKCSKGYQTEKRWLSCSRRADKRWNNFENLEWFLSSNNGNEMLTSWREESWQKADTCRDWAICRVMKTLFKAGVKLRVDQSPWCKTEKAVAISLRASRKGRMAGRRRLRGTLLKEIKV